VVIQTGSGETIWAFALAFVLYAGWLDSSTRRIPNWLTVPGLLLGVALHGMAGGWRGAVVALEGAGLALAILLPLVFLRALGAGDWKLMGALGAFLGPQIFFLVLLASVLVAGLMSVVVMVRAHRVRETLRNLYLLILTFLTLGFRKNPGISLDSPDALKVPFGVAAAVGTFVCFVGLRLGIRF
jgi:prepilin peptidase CpaA